MGDPYNTRVDTAPLLTSWNGKSNSAKPTTMDSTWDKLNRQPSSRGPTHDRQARSLERLASVQATVRTLQLDHTQFSGSIISYLVAFVLLILVPICKLIFVKADTDMPMSQLVFQPVVVIVGVSRSIVSFVFISYAVRKHGLQGILFLDSVAEEVAQIRKDYDTVLDLGPTRLIQCFVPSLVLYVGQLIWLYSTVDLKPLPFITSKYHIQLVLVTVMTTLSWIFQTTTYLYACVLFWKVCKLQELKMRQYYEMLNHGLETEYYVMEYERIKGDLRHTSRRFRDFLAFTFVISVSGALISMYEVVDSINDELRLCLWGELLVLTVVNLTGAWLCLRCSSKIAGLHKRIVKRAAMVHAKTTLGGSPSTVATKSEPQFMSKSFKGLEPQFMPKSSKGLEPSPLHQIAEDGGGGSNKSKAALDNIQNYCQRQERWQRRAAVVDFLSSCNVGITVYGFILDKFFVHTSLGALLTTLWFILGRSLQVERMD